MKITVDRFDWTSRKPDLVVLVGDPYQDFIGEVPDDLQEKLREIQQGFQEGRLKKEMYFSSKWTDPDTRFDFLYFHSSTEKGHTTSENLKTFLARSLRLAADTGRSTVAFVHKGPDGQGLIEQLVEGALVGTYKFREFLKDNTDRFEHLELILCPPTPPSSAPEAHPQEPEPEPETEPQEPETQGVTIPAEEVPESLSHTEPLSVDEKSLKSEEPETESAPTEAAAEESIEEKASPETSTEGSEESLEVEVEEAPAAEVVDVPEAAPESGAVELQPQEPNWSEEFLAQLNAQDESSVTVGRTFAEGVNLARNLAAQPASICTPSYLAKTAEKLSKTYGFSYQAFGPKELEKLQFVGHTAVGGGSANPPKMIEMSYLPEEDSSVHLVLLGKGVTFDSGGLSIKPSKAMHLMIGDMSGAAAVLGTMQILGRLRPKIKVTGLLVCAENAPDGKSYRPGDILRYKNGLSVHVENTDAEGRLLLADGLIRAGELQATHIVDVATLTGGCPRALGPSFTGILGVNRKMINAITRAGGNHGESYWRLPLPVEYKEMLKSPHADLNNVGGEYASTTTAALFLKEFVPPRTQWVHLDIASTFWKEKPWKYYTEGPSGTAVKTLADLALRWHEHLA